MFEEPSLLIYNGFSNIHYNIKKKGLKTNMLNILIR